MKKLCSALLLLVLTVAGALVFAQTEARYDAEPIPEEQSAPAEHEPKEEHALFTYCPLYFSGQWNGAYYHYSEKCSPSPTYCTYAMITGDRMHAINHHCENCSPSDLDCSDGFGSARILKSRDGKWAMGDREQPRYVPPRREKDGELDEPGTSDSSDGVFYKAGIHIQHVEGSDEAVWIQDNAGKKRWFRVLIVKINLPNFDEPLAFGQEMNPNLMGASKMKKVRGRYKGSATNSAKHHLVHKNGRPVFVTSLTDLQDEPEED